MISSSCTSVAPTDDQMRAILRDDPLWASLKAVQTGQVKLVGRQWRLAGPLFQPAALDDIEAFFRR